MKLDGWEAEDDPLKEHLAHSANCLWAMSLNAGISAQSDSDNEHDPMADELADARRGTFGDAWPHEAKRGWKCKIQRMIEAGWCYDPTDADEDDRDGVTCFYCNLSLDGWEPKDDPMEEHRRRSPECAFFSLVEKVSGSTQAPKRSKTGKGKKGTRSSAASRLSTMSSVSTASEALDLGDVEVGDADAAVDDSIISTATTASQASAIGGTKGKKKAGRTKAAAKGAKGRSRASVSESQAESEAPQTENIMAQSAPQQEIEEPAAVPAKKTRKGARQSKQQVDSSVVEISSLDVAPAKKATRGRKAKAEPEPEPEPEAEQDPEHSEVSAQLQEELEHSMSSGAEAEMEDATPQPEPVKSKRGVKRTSDGLRKKESDVSSVVVEFPVPPKAASAAAQGKKGRKPSKQTSEMDDQPPRTTLQYDIMVPELETKPEPPKPTKSKNPSAAKGKQRKGKKASSTRSSRSSRATVTADETQDEDAVEDLERDEREIEAELQRIAAEQEKADEYEASPSHPRHAQKHVDEIRHLEEGLQAEVEGLDNPGKNLTDYVAHVAAGSSPASAAKEIASPSGSDKENQPNSSGKALYLPTATIAASAAPLSPVKTTRIPLALGTPNRLVPVSPGKRLLVSPSKTQLTALTSTQPWEAVDLDAVLLASPQPTPGTLASRLAGAADALTSPERALTLEEWVRWRAEKAEQELRWKCEKMVGVFESEGVRALGCLGGIEAV